MKDKAGMNKDDQNFLCDCCGQNFPIANEIDEDEFLYCEECFKLLLESGAI